MEKEANVFLNLCTLMGCYKSADNLLQTIVDVNVLVGAIVLGRELASLCVCHQLMASASPPVHLGEVTLLPIPSSNFEIAITGCVSKLTCVKSIVTNLL